MRPLSFFTKILKIIFLSGLSTFSSAELNAGFYDKNFLQREYSPVLAYEQSFASYDNVYIGKFDFTVTSKSKKGMVYLAGSFKVDSVLKGDAKNRVLKFTRLAHSRCIDKSERSELLRKSDVLAKDIHSGRKEMESVITSLDLNSNKTDCFFAVSSFQGDEEMPYKNKYELVFKQQQYVFFVNNKNLSNDGHINEFFVDLVLYDSVRALK